MVVIKLNDRMLKQGTIKEEPLITPELFFLASCLKLNLPNHYVRTDCAKSKCDYSHSFPLHCISDCFNCKDRITSSVHLSQDYVMTGRGNYPLVSEKHFERTAGNTELQGFSRTLENILLGLLLVWSIWSVHTASFDFTWWFWSSLFFKQQF